MPPAPKPATESATEMVQVVLPNDANPMGFMLGGAVMHLIDIAAAIIWDNEPAWLDKLKSIRLPTVALLATDSPKWRLVTTDEERADRAAAETRRAEHLARRAKI